MTTGLSPCRARKEKGERGYVRDKFVLPTPRFRRVTEHPIFKHSKATSAQWWRRYFWSLWEKGRADWTKDPNLPADARELRCIIWPRISGNSYIRASERERLFAQRTRWCLGQPAANMQLLQASDWLPFSRQADVDLFHSRLASLAIPNVGAKPVANMAAVTEELFCCATANGAPSFSATPDVQACTFIQWVQM